MNKRIPALFLHIQKTAGTSIVRLATNYYGINNVCSHGDYIGKKTSDLEKLNFISGHFGYTYAKELIDNRFSFTFLRNPVERVISFYNYCKYVGVGDSPIYYYAKNMDIFNFLEHVSKDRVLRWFVYNTQTWYLACGPGDAVTRVNFIEPDLLLKMATDNLSKFSFVGFTETFNNDAFSIMQKLNIPNYGDIPSENSSVVKSTPKNFSLDVINFIEELTHLDQQLYKVAWKTRKFSLQ